MYKRQALVWAGAAAGASSPGAARAAPEEAAARAAARNKRGRAMSYESGYVRAARVNDCRTIASACGARPVSILALFSFDNADWPMAPPKASCWNQSPRKSAKLLARGRAVPKMGSDRCQLPCPRVE